MMTYQIMQFDKVQVDGGELPGNEVFHTWVRIAFLPHFWWCNIFMFVFSYEIFLNSFIVSYESNEKLTDSA